MPVHAQMGPLKPITVYDAPEVIFTQLWDGEFNPGTAARTFISPNDLSPNERDGLSERLSKAAGDSNVVKALVGVATNPWAWLLFLTSPVGEKPVGDMFRIAKGFSLYAAKNSAMLSTLGMLSNQHALLGSRALRATSQAARGMEEVRKLPEVTQYWDEMDRVLAANGLQKHGLEWEKYAKGSAEQLAAMEIRAGLHGGLTKWNQRIVDQTPIWDEAARKPVMGGRERGAMGTIDPMVVLRKYGAEGLVGSGRGVLKAMAQKVYRDEDALIRLWDNLGRNVPESEMNASDVAGKALIQSVFGDMLEAARKGDMTFEEFRSALKTGVLDPIMRDETYVPLNVAETLVGTRKVDPGVARDARWAAAMRAGGSAIPRLHKPVFHHPDDLKMMGAVLGETPELREAIDQAEAIIRDSGESGRAVRFFRIQPENSIERHVDASSRTYAMFVQDIGEGVREIDRELTGKLKPWNDVDEIARSHRANLETGKRAGLDKAIHEVEGTDAAPMGGFTVADVLYADYGVAQNQWAKDTISKSVIPRLMGRISTPSLFKVSAINDAKMMANAFAEGDAGKAIEASGEYGQKFIQRLKEYGMSTNTSFEEGQALERYVTKAMWGGALGLNVPSAIINATQPFTYAATWGGVGNVLKAYRDSFKELGGYVSARMKQGWKPISTWERAGLFHKHFKFSNWNGEDLMESAGDTMDNLEGRLGHAMMGEHKVKGMLDRVFFEYPMALFKGAELLNRNVAAHTAWHAGMASRARGVALSDTTMAENIRMLTRETQYGGHWMNTPQAFLPEAAALGVPTGRLLANPLARQFLSFSTRAFTGMAFVSPRIGGREGWASVRGVLNDAARGMALSAIGYEAVKGLTGADISRAGFASGVTDIIPGFSQGRVDVREGPLPIPPVVDIPWNAIKGLVSGDEALLRRTIPRVIPGGVAISRAMGGLPDLGPVGFIGQQRYADWKNPSSDGRVPIFQSDGTLVGYETPAIMAMKALGIDMGAYKDEADVMGYLVNQREAITGARRDYMRMVANGNTAKAEQMAKAFEQKYEVPLTVTKAQWRDFWTRNETPRVDRQLARMPADVRDQFQKLVATTLPASPPRRAIGIPASPGETRVQRIDPRSLSTLRQQVAQSNIPGFRRAQDSESEGWGPFLRRDFEP